MMIGPNHPSGSGGRNRRRRGRRPPNRRPGQGGGQRDRHGGIYTAPMDHAYRAGMNGDNGRGGRGRFNPSTYLGADPEPLPESNGGPRIFAFVDDLFFSAKIQEVARKLNVKVEFVKTDKDLAEKTESVEEKPSLIIVDLNSNGIKPLPVITKMRSRYKKATSIVGFVSHVQGD